MTVDAADTATYVRKPIVPRTADLIITNAAVTTLDDVGGTRVAAKRLAELATSVSS